jgi:hypothetical protein
LEGDLKLIYLPPRAPACAKAMAGRQRALRIKKTQEILINGFT